MVGFNANKAPSIKKNNVVFLEDENLDINKKNNKRNVTGILNKKTNSSIKSFRVDDNSWRKLDLLLERSRDLSSQNISASRLIKSLIYVGSKLTDKEIIESIKETSV